MHKGIRHTRKNKSRRKLLKGGMGATEYVAGMYGDLNQQMANATEHMQLSPVQHGALAPQSGGKSRKVKGKGRKGKKSYRVPQQSGPSRLAGGEVDEEEVNHLNNPTKGGAYYPLNPAEYGGQVGALSDGQKGGYITELLERAVVPFGLMALRTYAGKSRKNRKYKK
jgi:hypothetical protein